MSYTLVADIADIDLTRHALIEASAGTGKTYTLENLVVRLLKERQDITIDNILMVTFTEKATSEQKSRIQENGNPPDLDGHIGYQKNEHPYKIDGSGPTVLIACLQ